MPQTCFEDVDVPVLGLVDSHCHLQDAAFDSDRDVILRRTLDALAWIVVVGIDIETSRAAVDLSSGRICACAGIHPHHASQVDVSSLDALRELTRDTRVAALGEIGLDYHYDFSPRDRQRAALASQLELAAECELPVVIHCREAQEDLIALVEPVHKRLVGGVMHCFGGDAAFAERCLSWGFHISFAGNVTYPKAENLRAAADVVLLERLLVETDSPYLPPQPVRGKRRCEPTDVRHTADFLAKLKKVPLEELVQSTTHNAHRLFRQRSG